MSPATAASPARRLVRCLKAKGYKNIVVRTHAELELTGDARSLERLAGAASGYATRSYLVQRSDAATSLPGSDW